jgi:hypothetical protein
LWIQPGIRIAARRPRLAPHEPHDLPREFGYYARLIGTVAQLVEQGPFKALVLGSSPSRPTSADFPGRPLTSGKPEKKQVTPGKLIEKRRFVVRRRPRQFTYSRTVLGAFFGAF